MKGVLPLDKVFEDAEEARQGFYEGNFHKWGLKGVRYWTRELALAKFLAIRAQNFRYTPTVYESLNYLNKSIRFIRGMNNGENNRDN